MNTNTLLVLGALGIGGYILVKRSGNGTVTVMGPPSGNNRANPPTGVTPGYVGQGTGAGGSAGTSNGAGAAVGILGALGGLVSGLGSIVKGIPEWGSGGGDSVGSTGPSDSLGLDFTPPSGSMDPSSLDDPNAFQLGDPTLSAGTGYTPSLGGSDDPFAGMGISL